MKKRILIFAPYSLSTSHHELALEMACQYQNSEWEPHLVQCPASLETCDQNAKHQWLRCLNCQSVAKKSANLIGIPSEQIHHYELLKPPTQKEIPEFTDLSTLLGFTYHGLPVGKSVVDSLISGHTRDIAPDLEKFRSFIRKAIRSYVGVYNFTEHLIKTLKPERIHLFNGRTFVYHASLLAAQRNHVFAQVGERARFDSYVIYENTDCLDIDFTNRQLQQFKTLMESDPNGKQVANSWFEGCQKGLGDLHNNYPGKQKAGLLPDGFSKANFNIVIYSSSEDELYGSKHWENPFFENQAEGVRLLVEKRPRNLNIQLYLRIHPNLQGLNSTQEKTLLSLTGLPNLTVIPSESKISSYELLRVCDTVVSFGSTIGIEAVYWGKPSILAGRAWYETLDACYRPRNKEEFVEMTYSKPPPKPRESALPYGYWISKRTIPFQFISPQDPKKGNAPIYKGRNIMETDRWISRVNRLLYILKRWLALAG